MARDHWLDRPIFRLAVGFSLCMLAGCSSFSDEVYVHIGEGARLISVGDGIDGTTQSRSVGASDHTQTQELASDLDQNNLTKRQSVMLGEVKNLYKGFSCTLSQTASSSSLISSLFSPPKKESEATLTCKRLE